MRGTRRKVSAAIPANTQNSTFWFCHRDEVFEVPESLPVSRLLKRKHSSPNQSEGEPWANSSSAPSVRFIFEYIYFIFFFFVCPLYSLRCAQCVVRTYTNRTLFGTPDIVQKKKNLDRKFIVYVAAWVWTARTRKKSRFLCTKKKEKRIIQISVYFSYVLVRTRHV